jgi:hypothetical protein
MESVEILRVTIATCHLPSTTVLVDFCTPQWSFSGAGASLDRLFATVLQLGHTIDADNGEIRFVSFQPSSSESGAIAECEIHLVLRLDTYKNGNVSDDFTTGVFFRVRGTELVGNDSRIAGLGERIGRIQAAFVSDLLPSVRERLLIRGPSAPPPSPDGEVEIPAELKGKCQTFSQRIPELLGQ